MFNEQSKAISVSFEITEMRPKMLLRADSTTAAIAHCSNGLVEFDQDNCSERTFRTMKDVSTCLRYLFQTNNINTLCIKYYENEMQTVFSNFIENTDIVLIGVIGEIGKQAVIIIDQITSKVHTIDALAGQILEYNAIEWHLNAIRPNVFFVVHGENSTGVLQPLDRLGLLCRKYNCILIVDAVDTLGAVKLLVDDWQIDVAYGTSEKTLGGAPGLVPITVGSRAMSKLENRQTNVKMPCWDLRALSKAWQLFDESKFLYSDLVSVPILHILCKHLNRIREEGLPNVIERHYLYSKRLQVGLEKVIGLELFVARAEYRLPTIVAVKVPHGINDRQFSKYLSDRHLIEISPGLGSTTGQIIRIGLMNSNANKKAVDNLLRAFYDALKIMIPSYVNQTQNVNVYY